MTVVEWADNAEGGGCGPVFPNDADAALSRKGAALYTAITDLDDVPDVLYELADEVLGALDARRECPNCEQYDLIGSCDSCGHWIPGPVEVPPADYDGYLERERGTAALEAWALAEVGWPSSAVDAFDALGRF